MNDHESILSLMRQLADEVQRLQMVQTVQHSAYVMLVHQLHAKGFVNLGSLVKTLRTMSNTQPDADWQSGHAEIAGALELLQNLPSSGSKSAERHGY